MLKFLEFECIYTCNYDCFYCHRNRDTISKYKYEKDFEKTKKILDEIKIKSIEGDLELFIFGGEPFMHPHIDKIIEYCNLIKLKFIIQTNFSLTNRIRECMLKHEFMIQVSVHPSEIKNIDKFLNDLSIFDASIRKIDVMYIGDESIDLYKKILDMNIDENKLQLNAVCDFFTDKECLASLNEYNKLKKEKKYNFEYGCRSYILEKQYTNEINFTGQICPYKDIYELYTPFGEIHFCGQKNSPKDGICDKRHCYVS